MAGTIEITGQHIDIDHLRELIEGDFQIELGEAARGAIAGARQYLDDKLSDPEALYYGISTGFGSQYHVRINRHEMEELQVNLIRSHAAGAGNPIPKHVAKAVLLLKILSLSKGHSGVRLELVERMVTYYNSGLVPVMYEYGSLGASGDLAPLAHLALTLIGEGEFYGDNGVVDAADVLESLGIEPLTLASKEGLALINGTQFSAGFGLYCYSEAQKLLNWASLVAAMSAEAFDCNLSPFDARIQDVRPFRGQRQAAAEVLSLLEQGGLSKRTGKHLQDPYAFRCIPQVHGASSDAVTHAGSVIGTEANSVTDNPLIFPESDVILSGGNFHAQPVALVLDYMAIAMAEIGNISERRTYQLLSASRGLPACLVPRAGLQSGLMIAQYTAAAIVNRNKILCAPASTDSIPSSMGQEDHVSMSANSAVKLYEIIQNCRSILAIELLCAAQAVDLKGYGNELSAPLKSLLDKYREGVSFIENDCVLHPLIKKSEDFVASINPVDFINLETSKS